MRLKKLLMTLSVIFLMTVAFCFFSSAESTRSIYAWDADTGHYLNAYATFENKIEFNGSVIKPEPVIWYEKDGRKTYLVKDKDYYLYYEEESKYPGYYYVDVYSKSGSAVELDDDLYFSYDIIYDKSGLRVNDIPDYGYTGNAICPKPAVYYKDIKLSTDCYTCYYYNNYDVTTADEKAVVEVYFGRRFGYESIEKTFNIKRRSVANVEVSAISGQVYSGYGIEPDITVKYGSYKLSCYYDYTVSYKNNVNVGTATLTIKGKGNFTGSKTVNFEIKPCPISKCDYYIYDSCEYTGKAVKPEFELYNRYNDLKPGTDYTFSYKNNVNPGTATITVKAKSSNYSGSKTINFKIAIQTPYYLDCYACGNYIELDWSYINISKNVYYQLYKYNSKTKVWDKIKTTASTYFKDTDVSQFSTYKYRVRARLKLDDTYYYSNYATDDISISLFAPAKLTLTTKSGEIKASWSKNTKATGYYLYRYDRNTGSTKKVYTSKKNTDVSFSDTSVKNYNPYEYYVVAYGTYNNKSVKSQNSIAVSSLDPASITRGAKLSQKTSYKIYNTQESKTTLSRTITLSKSDIATLKKFADSHFTSGMTANDKVEYTLDWIHSKVTYAKGKDWDKISSKTYVDAIFNYKLGQCAQYNGALAGMMCYLGYDVQMIKGYRQSMSSGYKTQHFWTECKINGLTYVMECGNKKDGSWHYFFCPYSQTGGYTKNGKYISGW